MTNSLNTWATWRELNAQPEIWREWGQRFEPAPYRLWIGSLPVREVWFCGAGTSAYIGDILEAGLTDSPVRLRSVPSTDLVSRPQAYLRGTSPLVVSFGRSGDSTESVGTLDALDVLAPSAPRLHITCNPNGALAQRPSPSGNSKTIVLPETTHDAGFAMTSSFSTMLLTALSLFGERADFEHRMTYLADQLGTLLPRYAATAGAPPARAVYLGTGPMAFAAREAALKVMELSAGRIPALWDSTLGFRHGPKSFVTDGTQITLFTSPDPHAAAYESDLVEELRSQFPGATVRTIGPGGDIDFAMPYGPVWHAPVSIAAAQVAGVLWSDALGLNVDDPFAGRGTLSRVVSGVRLHPVSA